VLVLIGALEDGSKELLAVVDGYRESTQSWPVAKAETADTFTRHGLPIPGARQQLGDATRHRVFDGAIIRA
jgi:hypothetical protein